MTAAPESPGTAVVAATGWDPVVGDGERLMAQLRELAGRGLPDRGLRRGPRQRAPASPPCSPTTAVAAAARVAPTAATLDRPGRPGGRRSRSTAASSTRPLKLAVLAEGDLTGRRRAHRRPAPGPATPRPSSTTSPPAPTSCTTSTAWAASAGWCAAPSAGSSATTCCSSTRAATSCTSPPTRSTCCAPYTGGRVAGAQPAQRRATGSGPRHGSGPPCGRSPRSWSSSTRSGSTRPATPFRPTPRGRREMEESFPYTETPDQLKAIEDVKADMERRAPDGPPGLRRRRVRQDRGRHPGRVQGRAGRQAGGRPRPDHPAGVRSTSRRSPTASPATRSGSRCSRASSPPPRPGRVVDGLADGSVDVVIGTHRLLSGDRDVQGPGPAGRRRGAALRGHATRRPSRSSAPTSTCSPSPPPRSRAPSR